MADALADADTLDLNLTSGAIGPLRPAKPFACRRLSIQGEGPLPVGIEWPRLRHLRARWVRPATLQAVFDAAPALESCQYDPTPGLTEYRNFFWPESVGRGRCPGVAVPLGGAVRPFGARPQTCG